MKGNAVLVRDLGDRFDVGDDRVGIGDRLDEDGSRLWPDCLLEGSRVVDILGIIDTDAQLRIDLLEAVYSPAVQVGRREYAPAAFRRVEEGVGHGRHP